MLKYKYTKIACYIGYVVQAIACTFLPLLFVIFQKSYNISYEKLGRLILVCFLTQLFVDVAAIKAVRIFGYRKLVVAAQILAAVGFACLSFLPKVIPPYAGITVSVIIYAVGSGLIEVIISPIMEYLPTENKSGNMALLHSFFCWGNVFVVIGTAIMIYFMGEDSWDIISLVWAVIPLIDMCLFLRVPIVEPQTEHSGSVKKMLSSPMFFAMLFLMFFSGASEISVSNWMSAFAEQSLRLPKVLGDLVGTCLFAVCMGLGRVLFSFFGDKISIKKVLLVFSFFAGCAYLVLALSKSMVASLFAGVFIGFCVSVMWPGVLSLSASHFTGGATAMFGLLAMCGDLGCSFGPWLTGAVADRSSLNTGFLAASAFPILMFILMLILNRKRVKKL